jgi:hypothetical protein
MQARSDCKGRLLTADKPAQKSHPRSANYSLGSDGMCGSRRCNGGDCPWDRERVTRLAFGTYPCPERFVAARAAQCSERSMIVRRSWTAFKPSVTPHRAIEPKAHRLRLNTGRRLGQACPTPAYKNWRNAMAVRVWDDGRLLGFDAGDGSMLRRRIHSGWIARLARLTHVQSSNPGILAKAHAAQDHLGALYRFHNWDRIGRHFDRRPKCGHL